MRKIINIISVDVATKSVAIALCDDGTCWELREGDDDTLVWLQGPSVSQDNVEPPGGAHE